ncbi:MAG: hypothetical protein AB4058_21415 [Microcystaceae cyanobacterium]
MNTETLFENLHQGFRITVGATASLIETLQDPERRSQTLTDLQADLSEKAKDWASKGENTEEEARRLTEEWFSRFRESQTVPTETTVTISSPETPSTSEINIKTQIKELTAQISGLREELEELRSDK